MFSQTPTLILTLTHIHDTVIDHSHCLMFAGYELVLPYVVERKVVADLCSSIIDGRYKGEVYSLWYKSR
jgi:ERCC4-type nuclease